MAGVPHQVSLVDAQQLARAREMLNSRSGDGRLLTLREIAVQLGVPGRELHEAFEADSGRRRARAGSGAQES